MPDRDLVHKGLPYRYQVAYKLICENVMPSTDIARSIMKPVKHDLIGYGDGPVHFIEQASVLAGRLDEQRLIEDWGNIHSQIERLARMESGVDKRGMSLAKCAIKETINEIRYGQHPENFNLQAYRKYIWGIVNSNFVERAPRIPLHYNNVDHLTFRMRLQEQCSQIAGPIEQLAQKLAKNKSVAKIRLPRMVRPKIDLDTNLHSRLGGESRWNR